jgi:hypothetical protein
MAVKKRALSATFVAAALGLVIMGTLLTGAGGEESDARIIRGGGTTIVEGGTGKPSLDPLITKFAFNWRSGEGHFECLALAPSDPAGEPGSGDFDTNVMYVTGDITSARVQGQTAVLTGSATVTGVGAGEDQAFTALATRGGPGATLVLEVSGLTFKEILLEGEIAF